MSVASETRVNVEIADHIAEVRLNRPEKHNALDAAMFEGISAAIDEVAADPSVRAVVLHGEGKSFCSGLDIMSFVSEGRPVEEMFARREGEDANLPQRVSYGWQLLPAPVIAAIHGNCIGGGAQIALGADVRMIAPGSRFSIRETHWGLIPDMGITRSLPRLVRFDVAKELVLTARILEAEEAVRVGLATRLADDPLAAARELAGEIASRSPDATRRGKLLLERGWNLGAAESLALEEELQRELLNTPNQIKAVAAGMSGDPADFDDPGLIPMPERSRFTLLTVRGIPIGVDWSWFFVLFLIIWLLSGYYRDLIGSTQDSIEPYTLAVLSAFGFFASILLHELGHALIALRNKIGISQITLWMFGGIASLDREPESPGAEFRIAAAGPAVTLAITIVCLAVGAALDGATFWEAAAFDENAQISASVAVLAWLANINAAILIFNLLPAFPLDGGRIVRAIAWKTTSDRDKGTLFAARLGQGFAYAFIAIGILLALSGSLFGGVWLALIGWMLGGTARATANRSKLNRKLGDIRVADVMDSEPVSIPAGTTVDRALDEYFLRYRWPWFPVVDPGQRFLGLLNRGTADAVPETSRTSQTVSEILDPSGSSDQTVPSDEPLEALLANVELRRLGALAAVDADGRLAGVITLEQVGRALRDAAT